MSDSQSKIPMNANTNNGCGEWCVLVSNMCPKIQEISANQQGVLPVEGIMSIHSDQLLKAIEVAKILNISRSLAYRLMQQGKIRTIRIGSARRVRLKDLQTYIEENNTSEE